MSKSLAELRQSPRVGLPERTYPLCLAPKLVGEVQELWSALEDATVAEAAARDGDEATKPKRMGDTAETQKIREKLTELRAEMADHTGTLTLRGSTEGDWRLWVDAHPPREDNTRDESVTFGICNADSLIDDLEKYATEWNDQPVGPGDWEFIKSNAAAGDIKELGRLVVAMHEVTVDVPKLLSSSLGILAG